MSDMLERVFFLPTRDMRTISGPQPSLCLSTHRLRDERLVDPAEQSLSLLLFFACRGCLRIVLFRDLGCGCRFNRIRIGNTSSSRRALTLQVFAPVLDLFVKLVPFRL
jgi:hypothetical protein